LIDDRLIGYRAVEVAVRFVVRLVALGHLLAREPPTEPAAFDFGHMSEQTEQRHRRWLNRAAGKLLGVEAFALELQGDALATQEFDEGRALVAKRGAALARVRLEIHEHVGAVLRLRHNAMLAAPRSHGN